MFAKFTLSSNGKPIYIDIDKIVAFYNEPINGGTKITTLDNDYTIVAETIVDIIEIIALNGES